MADDIGEVGSSGSQGAVPGPAASPEHLLETGIIRPCPGLTESETPGMRPSRLCFNKPSDGSHGPAAWEQWRTPFSEAQWEGLGRGAGACQGQGLVEYGASGAGSHQTVASTTGLVRCLFGESPPPKNGLTDFCG